MYLSLSVTENEVAHPQLCKKYVHMGKNEVSWLMPSSLSSPREEWKAVSDDATGFYYFYHRDTRQTTWNKPDSFSEWRAVRDISGDITYYNVLTRSTSHTNPRNDTSLTEETRTEEKIEDMSKKKVFVQNSTGDRKSQKQEWKAVLDEDTGCYYFYNTSTRHATWKKPDSFSEWRAVKSINGDTWYQNVLTGMISQTTSDARDESGSFRRATDNQEKILQKPFSDETRLKKSLDIFCPEVRHNELLLRKFKGKERQTLKTIESLMIHTCCPSDEIRASIESLFKANRGRLENDELMDLSCDNNVQQHSNPFTTIATPLHRSKVPIIYQAGNRRDDLTIQYL